MAPAAVQPPEVQFAQRLAANEKRIRDRALKKLRAYISVRTQRPAGRARHGGATRHGPAWPEGGGVDGGGSGAGAWTGTWAGTDAGAVSGAGEAGALAGRQLMRRHV